MPPARHDSATSVAGSACSVFACSQRGGLIQFGPLPHAISPSGGLHSPCVARGHRDLRSPGMALPSFSRLTRTHAMPATFAPRYIYMKAICSLQVEE
jgi:hypothetical protein